MVENEGAAGARAMAVVYTAGTYDIEKEGPAL